jgi:uncharacterized protein (DUF2132 family)
VKKTALITLSEMIDRAPAAREVALIISTTANFVNYGGRTWQRSTKQRQDGQKPKRHVASQTVSPDAVRPTIVTTVPLRGKLKTSSRLMSTDSLPGSDRPARQPLHGVKLETIVTALSEHGWESLGQQIIRCFTSEPCTRVQPEVLAQTPWARDKVESLYLFMLREIRRNTPVGAQLPTAVSRKQGQLLTRTDIDVVHQDEHFLFSLRQALACCQCPAGVRTTGLPGRPVLNHFPCSDRSPPGHGHHRLLLMARSPAMQRAQRAIRIHTVTSSTSPWSMAAGGAPTEWAAWQLIDLPIAVDWPRRPLHRGTTRKARQTRWQVLSWMLPPTPVPGPWPR